VKSHLYQIRRSYAGPGWSARNVVALCEALRADGWIK
jgi:hypothetical protein